MSDKAKDTKNLERVRDNQRRSRARRREHLIELEHRIRVYELQGIEASAEVQQAARRVDEQNRRLSEENRQLRAILNRHGFSDDYILSCMHSSAGTQTEHGQSSQFMPGAPSEVSQTLQQTLAPRRPTSFDHGVLYPIPPQEDRQTSIASLPVTSASSIWQPAQPIHPGHPFSRPLPSNAHLPPAASLSSNNPLAMNILPSNIPPSNIPPPLVRPTVPSQLPSQPYLSSVFQGPQVPRRESYHQSPAPGSLMEDQRRDSYSLTPMSDDSSSALSYTIPMQPFQPPGGPDAGGLGTNPETGPPPC